MEISLKSQHTEGSFSVVQFRAAECDTLDYISIGNAVKQGKLEVTEVSEGGSVNDILVVNRSEKCVFISEGDLLQGAKQNRVLITSVFLTPDAKFHIPVNCVEQGRWSRRTKNFTPHQHTAPVNLKKAIRNSVHENLKASKMYRADQHQTWSSVSERRMSTGSYSPTEDLIEIMKEKSEKLESRLKQFQPEEEANGMVIFYAGAPVIAEYHNRRDIFREYFSKVVLSAYEDYEFFFKKDYQLSNGELEYKTIEFMESLAAFEKTSHKGVAAGEEKRFRDDVTSGIELLYQDKMVHLSVLKDLKN